MGSCEVVPTRTVPKSSEVGEKVMIAGVALPRRLMNSSGVVESEVISRAAMRVPGSCGVKLAVMGQLAPGRSVAQVLVTVKSGVDWRAVMWMVVVPVLASVRVCGADALPTPVGAKVRELWEAAKEMRGAVLGGEETRRGAASPVRSRTSGLERASLSTIRAPASLLRWAEGVPVACWLSGV